MVVLGATSAIARSIAEQLGMRGFELILAGRDVEEIETLALDLELRCSVKVTARSFDALAFETHRGFFDDCRAASDDTLFGVVLCFGYLGDQAKAQEEFGEARQILDTNFLAAVSALNVAAKILEEKGEGFLCALSSVAGDRGRRSNYFYGAAKAGLTAYLQGLRNRLSASGVRVITIKPGFVDTRMTFGRPAMFLVASPEAAARRIVAAIERGKDVSYVPGFWRPVMIAIRAIPEKIFKRMNL
ncbi:MAG: SDR family oxidoreductase [Acidobacteriota bacterium]